MLLPAILAAKVAAGTAQDPGSLQLTALSFSSGSVDTSSGPASLSVNVSASSATSGVSYFEIALTDPSRGFVRRGSAAVEPAGAVSTSVSLTFPQSSVSGAWTVQSVFLADKAGNTRIFGPHDLASAGFPASVSVTSARDNTPPRLTRFAIAPSRVDTTSAPAVVHVNFEAADDLSGVHVFQVALVGPSGTATLRGAVSLLSSTSAAGSASITFPQFSEGGTWTVEGVFVADIVGNTLALDRSGLSDRGFPSELSVASTADVTPPKLVRLSLTPMSLNTSDGPAQVKVTFAATDDISGVAAFQISFVSPAGTVARSATSTLPPAAGVTGSATVDFPRFSEPGAWTVGRVLLQDAAGNTLTWDLSELASRDLPTTLTVESVSDSTRQR